MPNQDKEREVSGVRMCQQALTSGRLAIFVCTTAELSSPADGLLRLTRKCNESTENSQRKFTPPEDIRTFAAA